ncbi:SUMF1/EgtB/PvdO family nonheme iron enzyme [Ruficoccus amylovorans]|uniref:SUMF1/EgtB/PvdO family nonheme iron enzyme n=1 Tax=Ruficoccus amylovorans TaxID=1804625 RepID=A0A842HBR4_9BACT|nr:SUMF1/EgtB/PvdO family nonheme iron enzyme [Ruficoccus amylovorans]MBC2593057.1 SUMF1/EgtB/PvdO family nonheme iron enzyme [Ruficoccus amylovorans]
MPDQSADSSFPVKPPPGRAYEVLTPGEKFGDYQVLRCLTYDLMGSLYRVRKARVKETRSLFVLPPLVQNDAQFRERFFHSTSRLVQLDHPNLLKAEDAELIKGRFTIFHEAFDGQNLADYLEQCAIEQHKGHHPARGDDLLADMPVGLPEEEVRQILRQILEGLSYAHTHKQLHLNLNPTNILRNSKGEIKLAELGVMTMAGKELFETLVSAGIPPISLGPRRIRINTVDILSPEARLGKPGDERSDIYAFGITAYWLLTGQKPGYNYTPPSEVNPALDKSWDTLLANCLERDPDKRYPSAKAVLDDLKDLRHIQQRHEPLEPGTAQTRSVFRHMDFIPVPRQIKRHGLKTTRAFRIGIIGLVACVAFYLLSMFYDLAFGGETPIDSAVAIRTPAGQTPRLSIRTDPPNALLEFSGKDTSFNIRNGSLDLNVVPGLYRLTLSSPHHLDYNRIVEIGRTPQTLDIRLEPALANVNILTTPGARAVAIDASRRMYDLGTADENGLLQAARFLYAGTYTLRLEKENYMTMVKEDFHLGESDSQLLEFPLVPLPGTLRVRSTPRDATIYVEGREIGKTNATIEGLPVQEEFIVTLEKPGFRTEKLAVNLAPNTRTVLDFGELTPRSGEVLPQVTFGGKEPSTRLLEGLTYHVGDKTFPGTANVLSDIPEGRVTLTATHPDYLDATQTFQLADNTLLRLPLDLPPRPGVVQLDVQPAGLPLTVSANDKVLHLKDARRFTLPPDEDYSLILEAPDYISQQLNLRLAPNETRTWSTRLTPLPGPATGLTYNVPYLGIDMAWIPPGTFLMGSPVQEHARLPVEGPQTEVTLTHGFWLSRTEITQQQYQALMGENPSEFKGLRRPVEKVTWLEAVAFCEKLNQREQQAGRLPAGYVYRLPTEAEWEYAARAGTTTPFYWGDTADITRANFRGKYPRDFTSSQLEDPEFYGTSEVGDYPPNAFGLSDIHGNVAEWCLDVYNGRLPGGKQTDWVLTGEGSHRVVRGGGWEDYAIRSRIASRKNMAPDTRNSATGFRLCLGPVIGE